MNPKSRAPVIAVATVVGVAALLFVFSLANKSSFFSLKSEPPVIVSTMTVHPNDNVALILKRDAHLSNQEISSIQKVMVPVFKERSLRDGDNFAVTTSTDGIFKKLVYSISDIHSYEVIRSTLNVYAVKESMRQTVWVQKIVTGEVGESMYRDLLKKGYDETFVSNVVIKFADNIFAWKINFFTEQRPGDKITILLEQEKLVDSGKFLNRSDNIHILAATYVGKATRQKQNFAYLYQLPGSSHGDYYDEEGNAVRKVFLRAPFKVGDSFHISSRFSEHRFHPILKIYRPHHGTDFAAAYGTRVYSIGNGKVIYAGWKEGFGNCVEVRHDSRFVSRYGHLSSIAVKLGASILQSTFVGRVGSTGLSTGPHLHFEMLVDGSPKNFSTMSFPPASAVEKKYMDDFKRARDGLIARLNAADQKEQTKDTKKS